MATKLEIPEQLKADLPHTQWGKMLSATPVVMTVVATLLAGLASSEMTRAQYDRSLAAQLQSKAGDQWSYFQAKRVRGALERNALDLLRGTTDLQPLDASVLQQQAERLPRLLESIEAEARQSLSRMTGTEDRVVVPGAASKPELERYLQGKERRQAEAAEVGSALLELIRSADGQRALTILESGRLPEVPPPPVLDPRAQAALEAIERAKPEEEVAVLLSQVKGKGLDEAVFAAQERARLFDGATRPVNQAIDRLEKLLVRQAACLREGSRFVPAAAGASGPSLSLSRDFTAARLRYNGLRYDTEATLNQVVANLYELQVRQNNISAGRHHARSQRFFFGMLAAQAAVIIATLAMATRRRNLLWSLAASAGLAAVAFAIYVYLYV